MASDARQNDLNLIPCAEILYDSVQENFVLGQTVESVTPFLGRNLVDL